MAAGSFKSSGFRELDRKFAQLDRAASPEAKQRALVKGATIIADEERRLVHSRSGQLARSIVVTPEADGLPTGDVVYFGPSLPDGWYGNLVEDGHPNAGRHPFARPALDSKAEQAANVVVRDLMQSVMKAVR
jgi:HK97 gp10 family phage protein